jgi:hypothetical protein
MIKAESFFTSSSARRLEPSPPDKGEPPQGSLTPGQKRCESGTMPHVWIRQGSINPRALGPSLTVAIVGAHKTLVSCANMSSKYIK